MGIVKISDNEFGEIMETKNRNEIKIARTKKSRKYDNVLQRYNKGKIVMDKCTRYYEACNQHYSQATTLEENILEISRSS